MNDKKLTQAQKEVADKHLNSQTPSWFRDGVLEFEQLGISPKQAIARMKAMQFKKSWVN